MKRANHAPSRVTSVMLMVVAFISEASAASTPLNAKFVLRPLTPGDVTLYNLAPGTEVSGGLSTVGIGTPVYLEAEINSAIPPASIVSVTWTITNKPAFSAPVLTNSPLGANIPIYDVSTRATLQVAGRMVLRPDLVGQYTVLVTIVTSGSGSTNVARTITAATYMGVNTCALCHSGGIVADDKYSTWQTTDHAHIFTDGINGALTNYSVSCLQCHTAGYDTTLSATNGGFDDAAAQYGWMFPTVLSPTNWAYMQAAYPNVATLGNIQCENCHGPGSQHAYALGNTNFITKTLDSADCTQCHDAPTTYNYGAQWYKSRHALTTGPTGPNCTGCHSAYGFIARMNGNTFTNQPFATISCQACHEGHGDTMPTNTPYLLRNLTAVTMPDGTVVTNAGTGAVCLQCHHNRNGSVTNQLVNYPLGKPTWYGGSSFGPHDGPQGDMIEGINAVTYGQNIPSSAHRFAVNNLCVGCHMQPASYGDPAYLQAGGHTFNMTYTTIVNGVTNTFDKVDTCEQCHGPIDSFDMPKADYNGDGVIEGVQTEVQHLLDKLSTLLPNSTYRADGNYTGDGLVKTSISVKTNWQQKYLQAGYNWQFVDNDGSLGVHNAPFAVGILKASISDLTGDSNNDGLPDSWQIQYFGSATNPSAAPNATPAGDGVPNWVKYTLGLNPLIPGISVTNGLSVGVVWADGKALNNPYGPTNTIQIYTAAEVAFNTQVGKTYQIQGAAELSKGWQNVGNPIPGTGQAVSYVTPTRQNVKQFYRVYSY